MVRAELEIPFVCSLRRRVEKRPARRGCGGEQIPKEEAKSADARTQGLVAAELARKARRRWDAARIDVTVVFRSLLSNKSLRRRNRGRSQIHGTQLDV
jgi:hypothetical protein